MHSARKDASILNKINGLNPNHPGAYETLEITPPLHGPNDALLSHFASNIKGLTRWASIPHHGTDLNGVAASSCPKESGPPVTAFLELAHTSRQMLCRGWSSVRLVREPTRRGKEERVTHSGSGECYRSTSRVRRYMTS